MTMLWAVVSHQVRILVGVGEGKDSGMTLVGGEQSPAGEVLVDPDG